MPTFTQWPKTQDWVLVPGLTVMRETEKAILFTQYQDTTSEKECWIPKSQIHFDLWAASRYFVGIATWLAVKRELFVWGSFVGNYWNPAWLLRQEQDYANTRLQDSTRPDTLQEVMRGLFTPVESRVATTPARLPPAPPLALPPAPPPAPLPKRGRAMNLHWEEE